MLSLISYIGYNSYILVILFFVYLYVLGLASRVKLRVLLHLKVVIEDQVENTKKKLHENYSRKEKILPSRISIANLTLILISLDWSSLGSKFFVTSIPRSIPLDQLSYLNSSLYRLRLHKSTTQKAQ